MRLDTELKVIDRPLDKGHVFANTLTDSGPSILCLSRKAQVPLFPPLGSSTPVFGDIDYFIWHLPEVDTRIVAAVVPGNERKEFALAWTTAELWRAASRRYVVIYHTPTETQEIWSGDGVLELSYTFPTSTWEPGGTIWYSADRQYRLQVLTRSANGSINHGKGPRRDPRVPVTCLDYAYRDRSHELLLQ